MAGIVSRPRPLKGLQKQRGFALQTVALLNEELLLFIEEPERGIFLHRLHVVGLFFFEKFHCFFGFIFDVLAFYLSNLVVLDTQHICLM